MSQTSTPIHNDNKVTPPCPRGAINRAPTETASLRSPLRSNSPSVSLRMIDDTRRDDKSVLATRILKRASQASLMTLQYTLLLTVQVLLVQSRRSRGYAVQPVRR